MFELLIGYAIDFVGERDILIHGKHCLKITNAYTMRIKKTFLSKL